MHSYNSNILCGIYIFRHVCCLNCAERSQCCHGCLYSAARFLSPGRAAQIKSFGLILWNEMELEKVSPWRCVSHSALM